MAKMEWDGLGQKIYETGVSQVALYLLDSENEYTDSEAWNGVTSIEESPEGGDETEFWADNIKYGGIRAAEKFGGTIEAYTYPDNWKKCDGRATVAAGVSIGQQARAKFGLAYRTEIGSDVSEEAGYKLHLVWGCSTSPSSKTRETKNDSPDASTFSWEFSTTPVNVTGHKPTSEMEIDSRTVSPEKLKALEDMLFGTESADGKLPMPDEVITMLR